MKKNTLFFSVSAFAMLVALTGCHEDAETPKDPAKRFASAEECEQYYGHACVLEPAPLKLTAHNTPLFTTKVACEAQYGLDNCRATTVSVGRVRPDTVPEDQDVDLSDPNWQARVEDVSPSASALASDTTLYYPVRRDTQSGGSYYYPGRGYYGGGPHITFRPYLMLNGGYTPPYVIGNAGRSALGFAQTPSAGPPASTIGKSASPVGTSNSSGIGGSGKGGGGISSGATGRAGGFGGTAGGASS